MVKETSWLSQCLRFAKVAPHGSVRILGSRPCQMTSDDLRPLEPFLGSLLYAAQGSYSEWVSVLGDLSGLGGSIICSYDVIHVKLLCNGENEELKVFWVSAT